MAQSVERILGKDEVTGSIPVSSSTKPPYHYGGLFFVRHFISFIKFNYTSVIRDELLEYKDTEILLRLIKLSL